MQALIDPADHLKGGTYVWHWLYTAYAEALLAAGRPEDALSQVTCSLELTQRAGEKPHIGQGLKLKGDILAAMGKTDEAERSYRAALEPAMACGMVPLRARTLRALGELLARDGRTTAARQELRQALTAYDALGLISERDHASDRLRHLSPRPS